MPRAVVVGLARSGVAAANLLKGMGMDVVVTDKRSEQELGSEVDALVHGIGLALGGHPDSAFAGADTVVLSPGVPADIAPVLAARDAGAEVIGEFELAWRMLRGLPFYAVTGTNGKSTTVTLLNEMMMRAGRKTLFGGNIGNPLCGEITVSADGRLSLPEASIVVAELSSFQLETIESFRPAGACVLNVTPDHLDRYASMSEYRRAKARISLNQKGEDVLVLNADDPECMKLYRELLDEKGRRMPRTFFFSREQEVNGVFLDGDTVVWNFRGAGSGTLIKTKDIGIKGAHNLENAMAASALALLSGCPKDAVAWTLKEFGGLEHRMEFVRELKGVRYINDSKGTNVGAVIRSLESYTEPVVLIAGGRDKNGDFPALAVAAQGRVREAVLIGEAAGKIAKAFEDKVPCRHAADMVDAVRTAREAAHKGDVVLLSPACASFDMFVDFEDRGRKFKEAVRAL
jgi:UDP-N-acetylmuramoylalanine--D-glutamate ligase